MPLCQICKRIDLSPLTVKGQSRSSRLSPPNEGFPSNRDLLYHPALDINALIPHYTNIEELKSSGATCELCRLIERCVDETLTQFQIAKELGWSYELSGYKFFLSPRPGADGFQVLGSGTDKETCYVMGGIGFCVDDESPIASTVLGRAVPPSPVCPAALKRIKKWIERCQAEHQHKRPRDARLPTRVLDIKSDGSEVLVRMSHGLVGDYAALSHCWGPVQPATLNKDTVASLMAGVNTNTLPRSFQDAVWLANELGIRYLWIDSLCILQDDAEDWARESARMSEVYGHAALTISAGRAAGCTEGFLSERAQRDYVRIPFQTDGHSGHILTFVLPKKYVGDETRCIRLEEEPLSSRGWALQERYLSLRTLHFGHRQTFFECQALFEAEDFCSVGTNQLGVCWTPTDSTSHQGYAWNRVVVEYSRRKLTFPDDKLPAVAGIAQHLANITAPRPGNGEVGIQIPITGYLTGLRWDNIIDDLCWSLDPHASTGERPPVYRAPSWSWASIDGPIEYCAPSRQHLAVARDAYIDLDTTENPFGKVKRGWLHLQALRLTPASLDEKPHLDALLLFQEDDVSFYMHPDWDAENYLPLRRDAGGGTAGERPELWVIPLVWDRNLAKEVSKGYIFGPFCLIVMAVDHQVPMYRDVRGFRRVGSGLVQTSQPEKLTHLAEKWTVAKEKGELEDMLLF